MRVFQFILTAALTAGLSTLAAAQTTRTATADEPLESHWLASAFVGSNFADDAEEPSLDFGGTIGYLWRGVLGAEFQANLSPDFELEGTRGALLFGEQPWINTYMANAIGAVPLGPEGQWRPYVSGGIGAVTLRSDAIVTDGERNEFEPDQTRFGGNLGFGVMGFVTNLGIRGDVRYFRGFEDDMSSSDGPEDIIGRRVLSELGFWRANVGVAIKW